MPDTGWLRMSDVFARLGVRARAVVAAVLVVGIAVAIGTVVLLRLTGDRIEDSIRETAAARAETLAALVETSPAPDPLPGLDPELLAQIIDGSGRVIASDATITGIPALATLDAAVGTRRIVVLDDILEGFEDEPAGLEDQGPYVVVVRGVTLDSGAPGKVLVAASLEDAAQARNAVLPVLGAGLPILLVLIGAVVWFLTGRALRPVDEMSVEAGRISGGGLSARLSVPPARDELQRLAETLNEMLARLEASSLRQRRFVSDASHELKSPLASIRTIVEVAGRDGSLPEEAAADVAAEVARMEALVGDLLYLAQHDESPSQDPNGEVDLDRVVASAVGLVRAGSGVPIDTSAISAVRVRGDEAGLGRMVRNLVDNASRHARSGVWVELDEKDGRSRLAVSDDGSGVPDGDAERIFERFVRLDESRARDTGGAGLGLAVVRAVAREHGGDAYVGRPRRGGATFIVELPHA